MNGPAYDRVLIAEMLDGFDTEFTSRFSSAAIQEQIQLLRAADNADAASVHTATRAPAKAKGCSCPLGASTMFTLTDKACPEHGTPQPAEGGAVMRAVFRGGKIAAWEIHRPLADGPVDLYTHPPAAQVQGEATLPVVIFGDTYEVPIRVQLHIVNQQMKLDALGQTNRHHAVLDLLDATEHCLSAADEGVDYAVSRPMLDAMTTLGLMEKVGRGRWAPTDSARRFVTLARTAHPSACELGAAGDLGPLTLRRDDDGKLQLYRVGFVLRFATFSPGVLESERCAVFAALQHRGDSRGGEA